MPRFDQPVLFSMNKQNRAFHLRNNVYRFLFFQPKRARPDTFAPSAFARQIIKNIIFDIQIPKMKFDFTAVAPLPQTKTWKEIIIDRIDDGKVVPITVKSSIDNVESIVILSEKNPTPMVARFNLKPGALPEISTRIKMGKSF